MTKHEVLMQTGRSLRATAADPGLGSVSTRRQEILELFFGFDCGVLELSRKYAWHPAACRSSNVSCRRLRDTTRCPARVGGFMRDSCCSDGAGGVGSLLPCPPPCAPASCHAWAKDFRALWRSLVSGGRIFAWAFFVSADARVASLLLASTPNDRDVLTCPGVLACLDGYMNIAMEQTEEYVNGQLKAKYGDCFIRGNNGEVPGDEPDAGTQPTFCDGTLSPGRES